MASKAFIEHLKNNEGYADLVPDKKHSQTTSSHGAYYDPKGYLTTGYGSLISKAAKGSKQEKKDIAAFKEKHGIDPFTLTKEQAHSFLTTKILPKYELGLNKFLTENNLSNLSPKQKEGLLDMSFNMGGAKGKVTVGESGLRGFVNMFKALQEGNIENIEKEAKNSKWFKKDVGRSRSLQVIENLKSLSKEESPLTPQQLGAMGNEQHQEKQAAEMLLKAKQMSIGYPEESDIDREVAEFQVGQEEVTEETPIRQAMDVVHKDNEELRNIDKLLKQKAEEKLVAKKESSEDTADVNMEDSLSDNKGSFYDQKVKEAKARNEARNKESLRVQNIRKLSKMGELGIRG